MYTNFTLKMDFANTLSRAQLQDLPAKRRRQAIVTYCDALYQPVYQAATLGKTSYLHVLTPAMAVAGTKPTHYIPTPEDILEGLTLKFPDCKISLFDDWVDVRPGVREQRSGILVDWS
jgi:hypothetical protein